MEAVGAREGDAIEIAGHRHTAALVLSPAPEDEGLEIIRLDGLERANAGVSAGERVEARRAPARPAARVTLAPAQKTHTGADPGDVLRRAGLLALRQTLQSDKVAAAQFEQALRETRVLVTPEMERQYEELRGQLKEQGPARQPIGFAIGERHREP